MQDRQEGTENGPFTPALKTSWLDVVAMLFILVYIVAMSALRRVRRVF